MSVRWNDITPFGVELDLDLSEPLSEGDQDELRDLFARHHLMVARNQSLDRQQQNQLTTCFGPLLEGDVEVVSNDPAVGMFGSERLALHSDLAFVPEPVWVGILHAVEVEPGASATLFASGSRAYDNLGPALAARAGDMQVLHVFPHDQRRRNRLAELREDEPRAVHQLVQTDKRSGDRYLYLGEMQTDRIEGLDPVESEAVIAELLWAMTNPSNVYAHVWYPGDCVIWDNKAVQHGRDDVGTVGVRTLQRTTAGELGFFDQVPQMNFGDDGVLTSMR